MVIFDTRLNGLTKLLMQRIPKYYPKISALSIKPKNNFFAEKYHTSIIYEFNIFDGRNNVVKNLIVKKRIFNPGYNNDISKDTHNEFMNLRFLYNVQGRHFNTPRVLEEIPREGILISEKIEGRSLSFYLKKFSQMPFAKNKKEFLKVLFGRVGRWLREFHGIDYNGDTGKINTAECIFKAQSIIDNFNGPCFQSLRKKIIERILGLESAVRDYAFPIVLKHGDFQPKNILCRKNHILVLDMDCQKRDISIKDVCNFITGVKTFNRNLLYSFWNNCISDEILQSYLSGYFHNEPVPYEAIDFMTTLGLLESLKKSCERNCSFIKLIKIIPFYKKALLDICEQRPLK